MGESLRQRWRDAGARVTGGWSVQANGGAGRRGAARRAVVAGGWRFVLGAWVRDPRGL